MDGSFYEWIIESTNEIIFPLMNLLVRQRRERLTWFDCKLFGLPQSILVFVKRYSTLMFQENNDITQLYII